MRQHRFSIARAVVVGSALVVNGLVSHTFAAEGQAPAGDPGRGVKAWADNCARCHNMRDPKEFTDGQWQVIVTHMGLRGGLTGQDARDILAFLQASN